jgi:hypothetical protein
MNTFEQEQTERTEITEKTDDWSLITGHFSRISVSSVFSCSIASCPAGSQPMKRRFPQEQTERTESMLFGSLFPLLPPVQIRLSHLVGRRAMKPSLEHEAAAAGAPRKRKGTESSLFSLLPPVQILKTTNKSKHYAN